MIKKYIALAAAIAIVMSFGGIYKGYAASTENYNYETAKSFFMTVGIIKENDSIALKMPGDTVTRAEFAAMVSRLYNGMTAKPDKRYFDDVADNSKYFNEINILAANGIVSGVGGGQFNPDGTIEYWDAVSMVLKLMGYVPYPGFEYPASMVKVCSSFDLLPSELISDNNSTVECLTNTVFLLADKFMFSAYSYSDGGAGKYKQTDETLLNKYFDIYKQSGILQSNGIADINSLQTTSYDTVSVDGFKIKRDGYLPAEYLGYNVDAYYYGKDGNKLIAVYENDENNVVTLNADDTQYSDFTYEYNIDSKTNKTKRFKVNPKKVTVIHNNKVMDKYNESKMLPEDGTVTFIDNNNDGIYDIVNIRDYISILVDRVDDNDKFITLLSNKSLFAGKSIKICKDEPYILKDSGGNIISADGIKENCIVSALSQSNNGELYATEIIVSDRNTVDVISAKSSDDTIYLENSECDFKLNKSAGMKLSDLYVGETYRFYFDFMGNIAYCDNTNALSKSAYGYLLDAYRTDESAKKELTLRIYNELGRIENYKCKKELIIDGVTHKNVDSALAEFLSGGNTVQQLILFRINEDKIITKVDTAEDYNVNMTVTPDNQLIKMTSDKGFNSERGLLFRSSANSFGGKIIVDSNTKFIVLPKRGEEISEKNCKIVSVGELNSSKYYNIQAYQTDKESAICDFAVITLNGKELPYGTSLAVVTKIYTASNSEGDLTYGVQVYGVDGECKYIVKSKDLIDKAMKDTASVESTRYTVAEGDLIRYSVDLSGEIDRLLLCYDRSEDNLLPGHTLGESYTYDPRIVTAVPYSINDGYLRAADISTTDFDNLKAKDFDYFYLPRFKYILNVSKNKNSYTVKEDTYGCIKTYDNFGTDYSKIIIYCVDNVENILFIYS